ncbi:hypothetical protein JCM5353_007869 [Sporobolomyces roseus]
MTFPEGSLGKDLLARLLSKGFNKICGVTDAPVLNHPQGLGLYHLPYQCSSNDLVLTHLSELNPGHRGNLWNFKVPAVPMNACVERFMSPPTWLTHSEATIHVQNPEFIFDTMAGPRFAGVLGRANLNPGGSSAERLTPGMLFFHNQGGKVEIGEEEVGIDEQRYRHCLQLRQSGDLVHALFTADQTAPQDVKYEAIYSMHRVDTPDRCLRRVYLTFTASLDPQHAHRVRHRSGQAPRPTVLASQPTLPQIHRLPFY